MALSASSLCLVLLIWLPAVLSTALHTSGRWILDEDEERFKLRCVNWAGHMEIMIPEGLQHQPVDNISAWIVGNGFNCVRLTYSVEMALNPNKTVAATFAHAAHIDDIDVSALASVHKSAIIKNPFLANATVLETYSRVLESLEKFNILVILDNHVSKASWCCNYNDGNGWPKSSPVQYKMLNSRYFDFEDWVGSLRAMAIFSKRHPNIVGMSLRNELRALGDQAGNDEWYEYTTAGATAIHEANSDLLIAIGGLRSAGDLRFLKRKPLDISAWPNRTVWEFHTYSWSYYFLTGICPLMNGLLGYYVGFLLQQDQLYTGPLWLSEFGIGLTGGPESNNGLPQGDYKTLRCIVQYMTNNDADWAIWALQGSYYIRDGEVDSDEGYGLLTKDWSEWRNPQFKELLGGMWNVTQGPESTNSLPEL